MAGDDQRLIVVMSAVASIDGYGDAQDDNYSETLRLPPTDSRLNLARNGGFYWLIRTCFVPFVRTCALEDSQCDFGAVGSRTG